MTDSSFAPPATGNPLLDAWHTPFAVPPFDAIRPEHFGPAFDAALARHRGEIAAIAADPAAPTFANTITALERSGRPLARVSAVFFALAGAHSNDDLLAIERDIAPRLTGHWDAIYMNQALFSRIVALRPDQRSLDAEQTRVLERYFVIFRRAGAGLDTAARQRLAEIGERLSVLGTRFSQRVLGDEQGYVLPLDRDDDLAGLPDHIRAAAGAAARARGLASPAAVTLARSSVEPFLQFSRRRELREKAFRAWIARGEGGETDNRSIIAEMVRLRTEKANLLGYPTWAHYRLDDAMAKTPAAARGLLTKVWAPARTRALADRDAMQEMVRAEGGNFELAAWDWRYYAEKLRRERCDLGEGEIEPYLGLDRMIAAAFETARRLFGITVAPRRDVPVWHPDVRVWDVRAADGRHLGLFFGDYFARPSKRSGAWMSTLREQDKLDGDTRPLVFNVMNFSKVEGDGPALLSFDDARTLFHEFGHALHALLSDVTYPLISGTGVATDFVELPSQLYEHWLETPEILKAFAVHHRTGEPMPDALIAKLKAARTFNQGFATVEYVASAIVDLDFHSLERADDLDVAAFERAALERIGMPDEIVMRHRSPHFSHVFAGDHYSAAYYSYMWSEVLDADAFNAFQETGNVFDPGTAERLYRFVYSAGGARTPDDAYTAFRGRLPTAGALLKRRGLADPGPGVVTMDLHSAGHRRGVAAAPHHAATEAGRAVLAEGGNAIEAMVAMAATIAAVYPHMNHIGGDGFWLVRERSGRVRALMAAGRAGANARPDVYRDHEAIPARGPLAALTVPGAIGGWALALELAKAQGGRLPLDVLLGHAVRHARDGATVTRSQARLTTEKLAELKDVPGFARTFLVDGKPPEAGTSLKQTALATTLDHLAHAGLDDFYRGDVGREIAADLDRIGSPVTRADLTQYRASVAEPLSVTLAAGTLYNAPPPTQGLASLMILALFERLRVGPAESFDHVHGLVEATKRAFRVRDRVITDPDRLPASPEQFLASAFLDAQALEIDRRKAARWPAPYGEGDTVWMGTADATGIAVSYIQSLYWEFGSGCVLPATGVLMQNRGASFSLDPDALNALAPGRLPFHTLNPALAILADGRVMAYGAMGGDGQPQSQAALFSRHVLYGQPLDRAIDAPRWLLGRTWGSPHTNLRMEARFDSNLIDRMLAAGHDVEVLAEPYSDTMGHAGAVVLRPDGSLEGAHDPRADGGAAGI